MIDWSCISVFECFVGENGREFSIKIINSVKVCKLKANSVIYKMSPRGVFAI